MRRRYRGFTGQVAPGLGGMGWIRRDSWDDTYKNDPRYGEALSFCGMEDYRAYVAEHGAVPPGSAIYGTKGQTTPEFCIAPAAATAGPAPDPTFEPAPFTTVSEPVPESALPTMPPGTDPDKWAFDLWRTGYTTGPDPRIAQAAAGAAEVERARAQELETRQATEGGDGIVPELEARARVIEATRQAVDVYAGPGPGAPGPAPRLPAQPPGAEEKPNWLPLVVGAVAIYLMQ